MLREHKGGDIFFNSKGTELRGCSMQLKRIAAILLLN